MKKIFASILIVLALGAGFLYLNTRHSYNSKVLLAQELHKAVGVMMADMRQAQTASVSGVPADGQWHHQIAFKTAQEGLVQYGLDASSRLQRASQTGTYWVANHIQKLNMRRLPENSSILEVQLQAANDLSMTSNFKIRMQE